MSITLSQTLPTSQILTNYITSPTIWDSINDYAQILSLYLQRPLHYASQPILRAVGTKIRPGEGDNCNFYTFEVIRRIFAFTFGCILAIITLPLSIPGIILDKLASLTQRTSFTHWKGKAPEKLDYKNPKMETQNACSLWGGLPDLFGGERPPNLRMDQMAKIIKKANPDILLMQEMSFDPSLKLYNELKKDFSHFFTRISPNVPDMESGLFVACKYPVIDAGFILFPNQTKMHRGAFWIETPFCCVFTTHMEFGDDQRAIDMRAEQLKLIKEKIDEFEKTKNKPCFLLGDFNLDRRDPEYTLIQKYFYDPSIKKYPMVTEETSTCTDIIGAYIEGTPIPPRAWEYIDYAVCTKKTSWKYGLKVDHIITYDNKKPYDSISDHKGVLLTLRG